MGPARISFVRALPEHGGEALRGVSGVALFEVGVVGPGARPVDGCVDVGVQPLSDLGVFRAGRVSLVGRRAQALICGA